jgi:hypothetical protein
VDWREAKRKAAELGATGGVIVIHAHRIKPEFQQMLEIMGARCSQSRYDIARQSALGVECFDYSPHAHAIAYGKFVDISQDDTQYLYRNIRRMGSQKQCEKTLSYILNHSVMPAGSRCSALRYFGICSVQKLKPTWTGSCRDSLECSMCGSSVVYKDTNEEILIRRYIALGWVVRVRRAGGTGGRRAPVAPLTRAVHCPPEGLCTFS